MPWTYMLRCADDSYYVGSTVDLERRTGQHQAGEGAAYTRCRLPVQVVWAAEFASIRDAFLFEKQVQRWGRDKREALIAGRFDLLPLLASRCWSAPDIAARGPRPGTARPRTTTPMPWDDGWEGVHDAGDPWSPVRPVHRVDDAGSP